MKFLDTNILLRYLTRDDEKKASAALALLERVEAGQEKLLTSPLVIFETIFTLQKFYGVPRSDIRKFMLPILHLGGLKLQGKSEFLSALDLYVATAISFADAYNAVYLKANGIAEIYSWDKDFDSIPGVVRVEP